MELAQKVRQHRKQSQTAEKPSNYGQFNDCILVHKCSHFSLAPLSIDCLSLSQGFWPLPPPLFVALNCCESLYGAFKQIACVCVCECVCVSALEIASIRYS
jgi:hypothetical protein